MNNTFTFEFFGLKSPFNRFQSSTLTKNCAIENWQYPESILTFKQLILEKRPNLIIELGSYLGWSAINMAKICKENNIDCKILCIDTWLGSIEHWRKDKCNTLHKYDFFENGTSFMFDEFCKNVISHDVQDYIVSLPNTTDMIYKYLTHFNIKSDLIYVDASHEYNDVLQDLTLYYNLLNEGGYIFGDDVCWVDVNNAAIDFANTIQRPLQYSQYKNLYYIKK